MNNNLNGNSKNYFETDITKRIIDTNDIDLKTFEFLMSGRTYDHAKNQGLCYVWCVFKMVSIETLLNIIQQLLPIFSHNNDARKLVRLIDGSCLDGPKLATILSFDRYRFKGIGDFRNISSLQDYLCKKSITKEFYVFAYTGYHWVLLNHNFMLYDSVKRDSTYQYNFERYTLYTVKKNIPKVRYL